MSDKDWISVEEYYGIPCSVERGLTEEENRQVCEYIKKLMKDVPITNIKAADVQPVKHGRWVEKRLSYMKWIPNDDDNVDPEDVAPESMTEQQCSCCKRWTIKYTHHIELDYCPLCGARMDGDSK